MVSERVEKLLDDLRSLNEDRHLIVLSLRNLILSVGQDISEEVKYGGLLYAAGSPFCGVFSCAQHVSLEFSRGASLADPYQVLEGNGKHRRHIKFRELDEVADKHASEYVRAAFAAGSQA